MAKAVNPFTRGYIEYPISALDFVSLDYYICHETPFSDRHSEWLVAVLDNGDTVYIPYNNNRNKYIHILLKGFVAIPHKIYTIPVDYCFK